ncbi:GNAT family N-acetyltransferase [Siccirubricoccus sp. G192]|nr:GNAT family N-acetyltransferase [Siccirubricoccus sp. G192]
MRRAELGLALDWAAAEGWNPGLRDADAFWTADPGGFWLAELGGEPIASISVVRYGPGYGFLGFYIARPEWRGQGYGLALWRAGMAQLGERCIGLDGVVAQQDSYRKSGFTLAHRNIRFGAGQVAALAAAPGITVVPAASLPFTAIAAYDATCFEAPREAFLRAWLSLPGHVALAALRDGALAGYAVLRPCREGAKIGPLFANGPAEAEALFGALAAAAPAGPLFLDVPEPNAPAMALARAAGMAPVFETARMHTRPPPPVQAGRIFGITSFELG